MVSINVVQDVVGVLLLSSGEHDNLEIIHQLFKAVYKVGSESDVNFRIHVIEVESLYEFRRNMALELCSH
jgi:hypothetical protein